MHISFNFIWLATTFTVSLGAPGSFHRVETTFNVSSPTRSVHLADGAPLGISFEFFTFPDYVTKIPSTQECMKNLAEAIGAQIPSRIGGTTGDYGRYDPQLPDAINYTLSKADKGVPKALTFGPQYIRLASQLPGTVILGLNRKSNDLNNTLSAAKEAVEKMENLHAIELGNEPEYWGHSAPIAEGKPWNFDADVASEIKWQKAISTGVGRQNIIQAGNYLSNFRISDLARKEHESKAYIKSFGIHSYPQNTCGNSKTNLKTLMDHKSIVQYVERFKPDIEEAAQLGKPAYFSETNSAACGGGSVSPTFGAALWTVDYIMQSLLVGIKALYFHHGTLGNSKYSFWGRYDVGAPYYGAYFAAMALRGIDEISMLDDGQGSYAAYLFTSKSVPVRIMLYNSHHVSEANSTHSAIKQTMTLDLTGTGLGTQRTPEVFRLQASSSEARVDHGNSPDISGLQFENGTCRQIKQTTAPEFIKVNNSTLNVLVGDSEAVLIQF